ncbi:MAG: exopolysaccharide biosynthesis protein [Verrucomicrobia bacterium]|nr:exopolysaccharide biosynthesis protein [Verrucomicrobiota bacterium]
MQTESKDGQASLAQVLQSALQHPEDENQSIGHLSRGIGDKGFGLLLVILSLPSAFPVPAPGYSTPFGIAIMLIALQILSGRHSLWLPQRIQKVKIPASLCQRMASAAAKFLNATEHWIKPRHRWIASRTGHAALATVVAIMASLMILPIPLTNTFPAIVIFLIGIGLAEEDGLLALLAFAVGVLAVLLYSYIIYLFITEGPEAVNQMKEWIKGSLGGTKP